MWYLIVSIPDLCTLTNFVIDLRHHASLKPFFDMTMLDMFQMCLSVENIIIESLNTVIPIIVIV